jgi:hypothetical protein
VDEHGRTIPVETVKEGALIEVNLEDVGRSEASKEDLLDQPRTRYLFGFIDKANPDGMTYAVKYDSGLVEKQVPSWAIKKVEEDGVGRSHPKYKKGERVEARPALKDASPDYNHNGRIGIATREKLAVYKAAQCWPAAEKCRDYVVPKKGKVPATPQEIPAMPLYQSWRNPYQVKLCYYEPDCSTDPELKGCNAGKDRPSKNCRYCGFDNYGDCKRPYHCQIGNPKKWPQVQRDWCCSAYNIGCKYQCRWGKWWPDEAQGWGPWWSPQKHDWCCKNQKIGCKKETKTNNLMFKYAESEEQLHQRPPPPSFIVQPMISTLLPTASSMLGVVLAASILVASVRRKRWNRLGQSELDDSRQIMPVLDAEILLI